MHELKKTALERSVNLQDSSDLYAVIGQNHILKARSILKTLVTNEELDSAFFEAISEVDKLLDKSEAAYSKAINDRDLGYKLMEEHLRTRQRR